MKTIREVTYYDVSPYAALSAVGTTSGGEIQPFSDVQKLFDENMTFRNIQTCEHNYTILDGTFNELAPDENIALWSKQQSAVNTRYLQQSITLDVTFGGLQSSPGISFFFDVQSNNWCDMLRVRWYRDNALLSDRIFYPNSAVYSCLNKVDLYNRVMVQFMRLNMQGRFFRLEAVLFGIIRTFGDHELDRLTINEGFDPSCNSIYINSANFAINTKDPVPYMFVRRQPLKITYNGVFMGDYYIDKSKRHADKRYDIEAVDKIGVLDNTAEYMGGIYDGINNVATAESIITEIVNGLFQVEIEPTLKNIPIIGWIPVMKRRDALALVALSIGAVIDAARSKSIRVTPIPSDLSRRIKRVYRTGSVDIEFPYTGVEVIEHNYVVGGEQKNLFKDIFTGEKTVKFSEPMYNLTITNGTILEAGANYAVIAGNGLYETLLDGRTYIDNQNSVVVKTEQVVEGTEERVKKIENGYLINRNNSQTAAQRLYEYYKRMSVFDGEFVADRANPERIGETVEIATVFEENTTGQIEKLSLTLGYANIKMRGIIRGN